MAFHHPKCWKKSDFRRPCLKPTSMKIYRPTRITRLVIISIIWTLIRWSGNNHVKRLQVAEYYLPTSISLRDMKKLCSFCSWAPLPGPTNICMVPPSHAISIHKSQQSHLPHNRSFTDGHSSISIYLSIYCESITLLTSLDYIESLEANSYRAISIFLPTSAERPSFQINKFQLRQT